MTSGELHAAHNAELLRILDDKSQVGKGDPGARADQLVPGLRHCLCCWILREATENQILDISRRYCNALPGESPIRTANNNQAPEP